jgi:hypothetical protein
MVASVRMSRLAVRTDLGERNAGDTASRDALSIAGRVKSID